MKNSEIPNNDAGCNVVTNENTIKGYRRVFWRKGRIVVFQDDSGRYLRADFDGRTLTPAVIRGKALVNS